MMEKLFERKEILRSFQKFNNYSNDLLSSSFGTFETRLDIFINFCENDKVMGFITSQLKGYDFDRWMDKFGDSGSIFGNFELPLDENDRLSLLYQILLRLNAHEFQFEAFCNRIFGPYENFTRLPYKFNEAITTSLVRDLGYKLEEIGEKIEAVNEGQQITQERLIIINNGNITNSQLAIGTNIKQTKISRDIDLDALINKLADSILGESSLKDADKDDLLIDVESMKKEMQKNKPNKERIMGYLDNFVTIASLAEISQKIIRYISASGIFN